MKYFYLLVLQLFIGCSISPIQTQNKDNDSEEVKAVPSISPQPAAISSQRSKRNIGGELIKSELSKVFKESYADTFALDVIYSTNRNILNPNYQGPCSNDLYGVQATNNLEFGICRVNVPKKHSIGKFELSSTNRSDTSTYFRNLKHLPLTEENFINYLRMKNGSDILLFIHGFNVKFEEAVIRAAQIAYDLKFQGPVVLFSWPAGASSDGLFENALVKRTYENNKMSASKSILQLASFFRILSKLEMTTHLIVHSMGHQVALPALVKSRPFIGHPFLGEVILNAPDIPVLEFEKLVKEFLPIVERVTLYCSYNDNAMVMSAALNGSNRLGACEKIDGIDTINVSEIDIPFLKIGGLGHSYYASRPILTDIYQVLLGVDADKRLFIRKSEPNSSEDFILRE